MDAALSAPRKAARYVGRLVHSTGLGRALSWLQARMHRLAAPVAALARYLGRTGMFAGVTAVITSGTGQAALGRAGRLTGRGLSWLGRTTYDLLDRGLRSLGRPGNRAADLLFATTVRFGGRLAAVAGPVVHRVARLADPASPLMRLLGAASRSFLLHRLLTGLIRHALVRLVTEALLIPAVMDSRLVAWLRGVLRQTRLRVEALQRQKEDLNHLPLLDEDGEVYGPDHPVPTNRAERRAAQRHQGNRPQQ